MTPDAAIAHWHRIIAGGGLTEADLAFAAKQLQKALRRRENDAAGVTLHSTLGDKRTVENTAVAANGEA